MQKKKRKKNNFKKISTETICKALTKANGMLSLAAELLDKSPSYISQVIKDPVIKAHLEELTEKRVDKYEIALDDLRIKGNTTAIIFFLKTKGRHRGYIEHAPEESVDSSKLKELGDFFDRVETSLASIKPAQLAQKPQKVSEPKPSPDSSPENSAPSVKSSQLRPSEF